MGRIIVSRETVLSDAGRIGLDLARGSAERLLLYAKILGERGVALGLLARGDAHRVYPRHILDCLRAVRYTEDGDRLAYDLGSGAGLPGLVLAIAKPECSFVLVDPRRRAAAFLELAVDRLELKNAVVAMSRAEDLGRPADLVTARAFAPLERAWEAAIPLLHPGGRLVYFAGRRLREPGLAARSLASPETPASVRVDPVVENATPLVIMARRQ